MINHFRFQNSTCLALHPECSAFSAQTSGNRLSHQSHAVESIETGVRQSQTEKRQFFLAFSFPISGLPFAKPDIEWHSLVQIRPSESRNAADL